MLSQHISVQRSHISSAPEPPAVGAFDTRATELTTSAPSQGTLGLPLASGHTDSAVSLKKKKKSAELRQVLRYSELLFFVYLKRGGESRLVRLKAGHFHTWFFHTCNDKKAGFFILAMDFSFNWKNSEKKIQGTEQV